MPPARCSAKRRTSPRGCRRRPSRGRCSSPRACSGGRRGGARALTSLVGREDELSLLKRRWSRALEGEGQFVQIVGEPGIGKSRLIEEFRAKLAETPHTWVSPSRDDPEPTRVAERANPPAAKRERPVGSEGLTTARAMSGPSAPLPTRYTSSKGDKVPEPSASVGVLQ